MEATIDAEQSMERAMEFGKGRERSRAFLHRPVVNERYAKRKGLDPDRFKKAEDDGDE